MIDPLLRLRELPEPSVAQELSARVVASAHATLAQHRAKRLPRRSERVVWALVAALSVVHGAWTVGFLNWIGGQ